MPVETSVDASLGITVHRGHGQVVLQEVLEAMDRFYLDGRLPELVLWDFTEVAELALTAEDVKAIATYPLKYAARAMLRGGRRAIVASKPALFGLGRMVDAHKESAPELEAFETRSFRSREEALAWLSGRSVPSPR